MGTDHSKGCVVMMRRSTLFVAYLGVMGGILLMGASMAAAQELEAGAFIRGEPELLIPLKYRPLEADQFGGLVQLLTSLQCEPPLDPIQTILCQQDWEQVMPPSPHKRAVELGTLFHRRPKTIPPKTIPEVKPKEPLPPPKMP